MTRKTRAAQKAQEELSAMGVEGAFEECSIPLPPTPVKKEDSATRNTVSRGNGDLETEIPSEGELAKPKSRKSRPRGKANKAKADATQNPPHQIEHFSGSREDMVDLPTGGMSTDGADGDVNNEEQAPEPFLSEVSKSNALEPPGIDRHQLEVAEGHHEVDEPEVISTTTSTLASEPIDMQSPFAAKLDNHITLSAQNYRGAAEETEAVQPEQDIGLPTPTLSAAMEGKEDGIPMVTNSAAMSSSYDHSDVSHVGGSAGRLVQPITSPDPLPSQSSLSPKSPIIPHSQPEDPIEAIDALEDAIEEVGKSIPNLDVPISPAKPFVTKPINGKPTERISKSGDLGSAAASKKAFSGGLLDRRSSVQPRTSNKLTSTTQPSAASRARLPPSTGFATNNPIARSTSTRTRTRPSSVLMSSGISHATKDDVPNYLATKRRPMSMQFPTPPPPPKSMKQLTKSTFTLPGDAIAAKLKLARQERLKREEEEAAKRKAFKARPVIKTKPVEVKQTAASRARLSIIGGVQPNGDKENGTAGIKRSSSNAMKRSTLMGPLSTGSSSFQKRASTTFASNLDFSSSLYASKRGSSISSVKSSVAAGPKPMVNAHDVAAQRQKGKAVFNRDKVEKEAREQERKAKDEAVKKARAEASERGRQASRDWAMKQKKAMENKKSEASQGLLASASGTAAAV